tara:strand:+ start:11484 stop:12071 length:588 start_codon:yes stop_codon:yes gene_type:complete
MKPREKPHYVNNREFSHAVVDYVTSVVVAKEADAEHPKVTNYIASCFLKISEGLSHKSNFIRYTYREEMVMDAVENCLKAIYNYNIDAATRTGLPNAFAYFTQICYYAFLRRIAKEKKQQDLKFRYMETAGIENFIHYDSNDMSGHHGVERMFVDQLRDRIDKIKGADHIIKAFSKEEKERQRELKKQGLELFMG